MEYLLGMKQISEFAHKKPKWQKSRKSGSHVKTLKIPSLASYLPLNSVIVNNINFNSLYLPDIINQCFLKFLGLKPITFHHIYIFCNVLLLL